MKRAAFFAAAVSLGALILASTANAHTLTFNQAVQVAEKAAKKDCTKTPNCVAYGVNLAPGECSSVNRHKVTCIQHKIIQNADGTQTDCHRTLQMFIKRGFSRNLIFFRYRSSDQCGPSAHVVSAERLQTVG